MPKRPKPPKDVSTFEVLRFARKIGYWAFTDEEQYSAKLSALGSANDPFALASPKSPGGEEMDCCV